MHNSIHPNIQRSLILLPSGEHAYAVIESSSISAVHSTTPPSNPTDGGDDETPKSAELHDAYRLKVLVPTKDNGGIEFSPMRFLSFEQFLRSIPAAFSRPDCYFFGSWPHPEQKKWVDDRSVEYFVLVATESAARALCVVVEDYVRTVFKQREVCITIERVLTTLQLSPLQLTPQGVEV